MNPTLQTIEALVKHWVTFVEGHVKMVLALGAVLLIFHFGVAGLAAWEKHDQKQLSITEQQIKTNDQSTKDLEGQIADLKLQVATSLAQNQALRAQLAAGLKKQVVIDDNLPLTDLSSRWELLLALGSGQVTSQANTVVVSSPAAHATVDKLEQVPVLTQQNGLLQTDLAACTTLSAKKDVDIANLHTDVALRDKALAEQAKLVSDARHEGERKGFKWGAVVSTAAWIALKIAKL